jgi:hypothetical protein
MDKRFELLPPLMRDAISILQQLHNTPDSLAMPAVLGVANLAVMPHYKVDSILFNDIPLSLYILCMLPTGMRKSTNYREISVGIERFERLQWDRLKNETLRYELDQKTFKKACTAYTKDREDNGSFGSVPIPDPVRPVETCNYRIGKATLNGIIDQLKTQPFVGLFSSEAGEFFNSHSFQGGRDGQSKATEMSAALTTMWDGGVITRQTGMDSTQLYNRAVNMMFLLQEETVREFLNNPMFSAQGFVHRLLITQTDYVEPQPVDLSSTGIQRIEQLRSQLEPFHARIEQLISQRLWFPDDRPNELQRTILRPTAAAVQLIQHYYNTNLRRSQQDLAQWSGFAERLLEHMLRIAGTIAAFELKHEVTELEIATAMDLMDYFTEQRLNLQLGITSRNQSQTLGVKRLAVWMADHKFAGTRNELRRNVRWFGSLTEAEKDQLLEDLVRSEQVEVETVVAPNHKKVTTYTWTGK